jgi:hypothetical protein
MGQDRHGKRRTRGKDRGTTPSDHHDDETRKIALKTLWLRQNNRESENIDDLEIDSDEFDDFKSSHASKSTEEVCFTSGN